MLLISLFLLSACDKKQIAIDNLSDFVDKVEKRAPTYTDEDWDKVDIEYEDIISEIESYQYSDEEKQHIARLTGKYAGIKTRYSVNKVIEGLGDAVNEIRSTIEGFTEGYGRGEEQ